MVKVVKSNAQYITGLSDKQKAQIKEELTLENPAYKSAVQYSRWNKNNIRIPKYIQYYRDNFITLEVPVGYKIPFNCKVEDQRVDVTVDYPKIIKGFKLRDSQKEAYYAYLDNPDNGVIVLPTGKGKSILGLYIAYRLRQKCLVIVHKDDLVDGWNEDIKNLFGKTLEPGLIKGKSFKIGDQITIASIATLAKRDLSSIANQFGMIIVDECHHTPAKSYDVLGKFNAMYKIGLTATDERSDGLDKVINYYLGDVAYRFSNEDSQSDSDILPVEVFVRESDIVHMPKVEYKGEIVDIVDIPYSKRPKVNFTDLDNLVQSNPSFNSMLISDILIELNHGHSCVAFYNQKEHCRKLYESLLEVDDSLRDKIQIYNGDSIDSKRTIKRRAENKEVLLTIVTYSIATEGTNVRSWEVSFLASSLNNGKNTEQCIGRIRRSKEGKLSVARVYDYRHSDVYGMKSHGNTRDARYRKLGFKIHYPRKKKEFTRGYNRK